MDTSDKTSPVNAVAVIGLGLIGASILKDIARHSPATKRYGWDSNDTITQIAKKTGLIDKSAHLTEVITAADLIIIATPMPFIADTARTIHQLIKTPTPKTITELGSVKNETLELFASLTTPLHQFIQTHPMGGSEKSGFDGSSNGLFRERPWIVCQNDTVQVTKVSTNHIDWLIATCGGIKRTIPAYEHDKIIASASHLVLNLSHLLFDFITSRHPSALGIAGESFVTSTRLASDNPEMIHTINTLNAEPLKEVYEEFLEFAASANVYAKNVEYFEDNKRSRDYWIHQRRKQS